MVETRPPREMSNATTADASIISVSLKERNKELTSTSESKESEKGHKVTEHCIRKKTVKLKRLYK